MGLDACAGPSELPSSIDRSAPRATTDRPVRAAPRYPRPPHPPRPARRADARLRHRPTTARRLQRRTPSRRKLSLPRPATPPSRRLRARRMGHVGQQSPRAILHAHRRRPKAARRRTGGVRAHDRRDPRRPAPRLGDMRSLMRAVRRLAYWLRFRSEQADLRDELAFHRDELARDLERRGLSPDAAHAAARRELGNETYMREEARGVWLSTGLDAALQDLRYAWRSLRRAPAFTAVVVFTLALGIGANVAIFTVVHHLLIAPLPYPNGNRIVQLNVAFAANPDVPLGVGTNALTQWEPRLHTLEDFASVS